MHSPLDFAFSLSGDVSAGSPERPIAWPGHGELPALLAGEAVHLVGIGGAGMSGLARVMIERGIKVSGSDRDGGAEVEALRALGASVFVGHRADQVPADAVLVVHSPAIPESNPELVAARSAGITLTKRATMFGALTEAEDTRSVAFAGTHGKTTTSAWLATTLVRAGGDPTFFVGGTVRNLGVSSRAGSDGTLILEADEYDRTFLALSPEIAVITTLEHDHVDLFPTMGDIVDVFSDFAKRVQATGRLIVSAAPASMQAVVSSSAAPVWYFGVDGDPVLGLADDSKIDWLATDLVATESGQMFDVNFQGECLGTYVIGLPGRHSVANALAVVAASEALGSDREAIRKAIASFRGAGRRFEVIGTPAGVTIIDDYAHHPTEVAATLAAARQRWPSRRIWAVLQPHTFSRVAAMASEFGDALEVADRVVITPVYGARETAVGGSDASAIAASVPGALLARDLDDAAARVAEGSEPGDIVLFMGAGDLPIASRRCSELLRRRLTDAVLAESRSSGLGGDVTQAAMLSEYTSLRVGGAADIVVRVQNTDDLSGWAQLAWRHDVPFRAVGRGTNLIVSDAGITGVVAVNRCEGFEIEVGQDETSALVIAESGVTLASLAQQLARAGWKGLEAAVGIPGSVGASVVTNAGAHGWEMADSIEWAEVLERSGVRRLDASSLAFRYRGSMLKGDTSAIVAPSWSAGDTR